MSWFKLVWFVPEEALDATRDAVFAEGEHPNEERAYDVYPLLVQ